MAEPGTQHLKRQPPGIHILLETRTRTALARLHSIRTSLRKLCCLSLPLPICARQEAGARQTQRTVHVKCVRTLPLVATGARVAVLYSVCEQA